MSSESVPFLCRAGRPIPFVQLRIVDAEMNDVAHDGVEPGRSRRALAVAYAGLSRTNPSARRSCGAAAGCIPATSASSTPTDTCKIVDRIKDVVKTGGEWVSSLDIEDLILRVPGVAEAAVVGVPDERWGERPVAFVVGKTGAQRRARMRFAATLPTSPIAARSRSTRCPTASTSSTRFRRPASGKLDKKVIRAKLLETAADAATTR